MSKPTKNNKFNEITAFIKEKCQEIKEHPSKINLINTIIEKYLDI
jgi:hypothetical protein